MNKKITLVLGASTKPGRHALLAAEKLQSKGIEIELLGKKEGKVGNIEIKTNIEEISTKIDTVTIYLAKNNQIEYEDFLIKTRPNRVIFNPGSENFILQEKLKAQGTEVLEACTLVMLSTGQY